MDAAMLYRKRFLVSLIYWSMRTLEIRKINVGRIISGVRFAPVYPSFKPGLVGK